MNLLPVDITLESHQNCPHFFNSLSHLIPFFTEPSVFVLTLSCFLPLTSSAAVCSLALPLLLISVHRVYPKDLSLASFSVLQISFLQLPLWCLRFSDEKLCETWIYYCFLLSIVPLCWLLSWTHNITFPNACLSPFFSATNFIRSLLNFSDYSKGHWNFPLNSLFFSKSILCFQTTLKQSSYVLYWYSKPSMIWPHSIFSAYSLSVYSPCVSLCFSHILLLILYMWWW